MPAFHANLLALALAITLGFQAIHASAANDELVILNWGEYIDPDLIEVFETRHNAKVREVYYESDEQRTQMLLSNDAVGYDLILTSGIDLAFYVKRGWIAPLDTQAIPNLKHLNPAWRTAFKSAETHAVPYFWGTVGIIYRSDLVKEPITHWHQLFNPAPDLQGHIGMVADGQDLVGLGLKSLGYSLNSENKHELNAVERLLIAQQPHVKSYQYLVLDQRSGVVTGDLRASIAYSGDALMVQEHHDDLVYVVPEEGTNIWVDYFALGAKAQTPELAKKFLNFINEPEVAAQMAEYVYYATPNQAAEALLPDDFKNNQAIYPPKEIISKSEFFAPITARAMKRRNAISAQILY